MKQLLLLFFLVPSLSFCQVQIGSDIDGENKGDYSGESVSLSSNGLSVAIGATRNSGNGTGSGHVRIFDNVNGAWVQFGQDIDGDAVNDEFGSSISLSSNGNILAIGSSLNNNNGFSSGHVKVYGRSGNLWIQIGNDLEGEEAFDFFGSSISLSSDGSIIAIGAENSDNNGLGSGHVSVYQNINNEWVQIGQDINGEAAADFSGSDVSLSSDGSIIAIGASSNSGNGSQSGHVRVFENVNNEWIQIGQDIDGVETMDFFGSSLSLSSDGSIIAVGAVGNDDNGNNSGHVRVFENINGNWTQIGQDINGEASSDRSGNSVSISSDGAILAIGSSRAGADAGHVRIFENINDSWIQVGQNIEGDNAFDFFGGSLSLSSDGTIVAIGAPFNSGNGFESGHVRIFDLSAILSTEEENLLSFNIYPNPAKNQFTIQLENISELKNLNIYNNLGQLVLTSKETTIDTSKWASGLYMVKVETTAGKGTKKLIIE